tara:strand:- start:1553 stop:1819 length:267 start_codon:yes stop_codon:yes gene_type:complete
LKLTKKQQKIALDFLKKVWTQDRGCNVCSTTDWTVHKELYEMRQFSSGELTVGGSFVPLLMLECKNCGNTLTINATKVGLVGQGEDNE